MGDLTLKVSAIGLTDREHWSLKGMIIVRYSSNSAVETALSISDGIRSWLTLQLKKVHHSYRLNELFDCQT